METHWGLPLRAGKALRNGGEWTLGAQIVVLSPHLDDACFSIGALLAYAGTTASAGSCLIDIFTNGCFVAPGKHIEPATPETIHAARTLEDQAFARMCTLTRYDLFATEPALLNRPACDDAHIEDDIAAIDAPLRQAIASARGGKRGCLFAPAGIGGHANHLATREWVIRNLASLDTDFDVYLYEDLPYAAHVGARAQTLRALGRDPRLHLVDRIFRTAQWSEKKPLLDCYPTQLRRPPTAKQFRPASLWPMALHEAYWPIKPTGV